MRTILAGALLVVTAGWACDVCGQTKSSLSDKQVAAVFEGIANEKTPGLAVLVKQNGRILFGHGYGLKESRTGSRIDTKTNFRLASVTKQFTAMAVMLLVHDKKLRYERRSARFSRSFRSTERELLCSNF